VGWNCSLLSLIDFDYPNSQLLLINYDSPNNCGLLSLVDNNSSNIIFYYHL